jgi:hypothetical protein
MTTASREYAPAFLPLTSRRRPPSPRHPLKHTVHIPHDYKERDQASFARVSKRQRCLFAPRHLEEGNKCSRPAGRRPKSHSNPKLPPAHRGDEKLNMGTQQPTATMMHMARGLATRPLRRTHRRSVSVSMSFCSGREKGPGTRQGTKTFVKMTRTPPPTHFNLTILNNCHT